MANRTPTDSVHGQALAATLARIAIELDVLALEIEQTPEAAAGNLTFEIAWHHACKALAALDEALEIRAGDLRVAA
jgi:hypothetical protein